MKYNDVRHVDNAQRREEMRPVQQQYGFFRVGEEKALKLCCLCHQDVPGGGVLIDEKLYHESCFVRSR